ncbi:class I SAM-dependent methyltransferase [Mesonia aquimarina]|uniref:class I SAM-dependent methyltransferase n=1 Tax=Mesonia aquimarina TaxID=1504967 RepID=UPI002936F970|nr:class I SAM-dependent methyltransferase [Mesonia aquimarina]
MSNKKQHWENVYETKDLNQVSWYQTTPKTSLESIKKAELKKDAAIIDIGGGHSFLVDHLVNLGYTNISVLDISEKALKKAQDRLGEQATKVNWVVSDVTSFQPSQKYDLWHDRAAFHFLTEENDIQNYYKVCTSALKSGAQLMISTFGENGPKKCSALPTENYNSEKLNQVFNENFDQVNCFTENHITPNKKNQEFQTCIFQRK